MSRIRRAGLACLFIVLPLALFWFSGVMALALALRIGASLVGLVAVVTVAVALPLGEAGDERVPDASAWPLPPPGRRRLSRWRRRPAGGAEVSETTSLERIVRIGESSAFEYRILMRPRLRAVAVRRLARAGVDPSDPLAVQGALGDRAALLEDQPLVDAGDLQAPGVPAAAVSGLLEALEELA